MASSRPSTTRLQALRDELYRAREQLLDSLGEAPSDLLHWTPAEGMQSLVEISSHLSFSENWWLNIVLRSDESEARAAADRLEQAKGPREELERSREATEQFLDSVTDQDLDRIYLTDDGYEITLEGVLRRLINQDLYYRGMVDYLGAWGKHGSANRPG